MPTGRALIVMTASLFLAWALILSQAMELVTRVFYSRADLDLIMSSPVTLANVFSIRVGAIALAVTAMAMLLSAPFIDVLALAGGPHWLAAYGVIAAAGISAAAVAIALTIVLFRTIGPKRTRLVAQVLAVIIGAGFVIALQIAAIVSTNTLSRFALADVGCGGGLRAGGGEHGLVAGARCSWRRYGAAWTARREPDDARSHHGRLFGAAGR